MLEFWFNPQITLLKKLMFLSLILVVTIALYLKQALPLDTIFMFAGTGILFLICRYSKLKFAMKNPTGLLYRLLTWIPIALLLALIFMQMQNGEILISGAQGIGFMALAICIFSPFSLFPNHSNQSHSK